MYSYLIGALGLALLMVVHEAGHFFIARAYGMRVTKFSIGFGPTFFKIVPSNGYFWFTTAADRVKLRLWKHDPEKNGPTIYQVAMIPFLAYVQIAGMNPLEEVEPGDKGSYANASLLGRIFTIFGGPLSNYVFASFLFFGAFYLGGRPVPPDPSKPMPTEVSPLKDRPAIRAGLQKGDRIVVVGSDAVADWNQMAEAIGRHPDQEIPVVVERAGARLTFMVHTDKDKEGKGKIGVSTLEHRVAVGAKEAAILAIKMPPEVVKTLVVNIGQLIAGNAKGELSGPVGMVKETAKAVDNGFTDLLGFLGALSAYLGAFNLIPFPALDGGRLMFLAYEATTRRRPNAKIEAHIHAAGLLMMLSLMAWVTFKELR